MDLDKFEGCLFGGAIGDAWGSSYEHENKAVNDDSTYYWAHENKQPRDWCITDDTQLTLATCEMLAEGAYTPDKLANKILDYYRRRKLTGLGSSTLKAILDLDVGLHWTLAGRRGEYAAGNGAAMRIAPFAFYSFPDREDVFNASRITHSNDEAFAGALAVFLAIRAVLNGRWDGNNDLFDIITPELPDTNVRDRLVEIGKYGGRPDIADIARLGNNGYVVNSVPFAIYSATKVRQLGMKNMFRDIIASGGDTDTNASIAGQIAGTLVGAKNIPVELLLQLKELSDYHWIKQVIDKTNSNIH